MKTISAEKTHKYLELAGPFLIAAFILGALWLPTFWYPPGRDQGVFAEVAATILRGGMPYRDAFDLKPPVVYYIYASAMLIFGNHLHSFRLMEYLWLAATLFFIILISPKKRRWTFAPLAAVILGIAQFHLFTFWYMAQADTFIALPILAGLWIYKRYFRRSPSGASILAGALLGIGIWLKFTSIFFAAVFIGLAFADNPKHEKICTGRICLSVLCLGAGIMLASLAIIIYFHVNGALKELWETLFVFVPRYASFQGSSKTSIFCFFNFNIATMWRRFLYIVFLFPIFPVIILPYGLWNFLYRKRIQARPIWLMFFFSIISVVAQGKLFPYHWGTAIVASTILSAYALDGMMRRLFANLIRKRIIHGILIFLTGLVFISVFTYISHEYPNRRDLLKSWRWYLKGERNGFYNFYNFFGAYGSGDFSFLSDMEVSMYVSQNCGKESRIFIWGFEPLVYYLSGRQPSSRFIFNYPIIFPLAPESWREEFFTSLRKSPPQLFLVVSKDSMPYITGIENDSSEILAAKFGHIESWLEKNYTPERQIEHFQIWRLKTQEGNGGLR